MNSNNNHNDVEDDANDCEYDNDDNAFVLIRIQMILGYSPCLIIVNLLHHFEQTKKK